MFPVVRDTEGVEVQLGDVLAGVDLPLEEELVVVRRTGKCPPQETDIEALEEDTQVEVRAEEAQVGVLGTLTEVQTSKHPGPNKK